MRIAYEILVEKVWKGILRNMRVIEVIFLNVNSGVPLDCYQEFRGISLSVYKSILKME
jgi:hypothetical protein